MCLYINSGAYTHRHLLRLYWWYNGHRDFFNTRPNGTVTECIHEFEVPDMVEGAPTPKIKRQAHILKDDIFP